MQFQSDMLQARINRSPIEEASAFGAVIMNGFAMKRLAEENDATALRKTTDYINPHMNPTKVNELYNEWKKAIQRTLMK